MRTSTHRIAVLAGVFLAASLFAASCQCGNALPSGDGGQDSGGATDGSADSGAGNDAGGADSGTGNDAGSTDSGTGADAGCTPASCAPALCCAATGMCYLVGGGGCPVEIDGGCHATGCDGGERCCPSTDRCYSPACLACCM